MPLYIKDDSVSELVSLLAKQRGLSKQEAVRLAVQEELKRSVPLRVRIEDWRRKYPLPPATGFEADRAFFGELSGEPPGGGP